MSCLFATQTLRSSVVRPKVTQMVTHADTPIHVQCVHANISWMEMEITRITCSRTCAQKYTIFFVFYSNREWRAKVLPKTKSRRKLLHNVVRMRVCACINANQEPRINQKEKKFIYFCGMCEREPAEPDSNRISYHSLKYAERSERTHTHHVRPGQASKYLQKQRRRQWRRKQQSTVDTCTSVTFICSKDERTAESN